MTFAVRCRTARVASCLLLCSLPAAAAITRTGFDRGAILAAARAVPPGGRLRVEAVPWAVDGASREQSLLLERFEVFAPNAKIVIHTDAGDRHLPVPANVYLRGQVEGEAGSRVVLSVLATGEVRGLATALGRTWLLGSEGSDAQLRVRAVDGASELEQAGGGFRCALDDLGPQAFRAGDPEESRTASEGLPDQLPEALKALLDAAPTQGSRVPEGVLFDHTAVIAIETDQEFLALAPIAGNTTTAANYIGDLVAFSSTIYTAEVQTSWAVGHVSLWASPDPWQQTSPSCGLIDFGRYWNNNHAGIARTVTHFLSGKSTNSGIAWIGVLCSGAFSLDAAQVATGCSPALTGVSNWGGGYGYTSGIDANFNINSPSVVWDIQAFTHEIGHNFNSRAHPLLPEHRRQRRGGRQLLRRTVRFDGLLLRRAPRSRAPAGAGSGTIMSYCHLLGGGNVSLTLGLDSSVWRRAAARSQSHAVACGECRRNLPASRRSASSSSMASSRATRAPGRSRPRSRRTARISRCAYRRTSTRPGDPVGCADAQPSRMDRAAERAMERRRLGMGALDRLVRSAVFRVDRAPV